MAGAIVSIVGRPNVGKSTLFNRLVGGRVAITEDRPGVTRDRLYREAEWQNHRFILMDTGGLELGSDDPIDKQVKIQVELGIEESDLILLLVDGREGVSSLDREIAEKIRRSGKKCLVVVNKIDSHKTPDTVYEFYELGVGEIYVISAELSYGLGDLLDAIIESLPPSAFEEEEEGRLKISLIGKQNAGKSSLVNKILGENRMIVSNIPGTTRDAIDSYYERNGREYVLIDTAGLRRKSKVNDLVEKYSGLRTYYSVDRSDLCLFLFDATEGVTELDTKIIGYAHNKKKASIIVVNKWDLIEKETNTQRDYSRAIRRVLAFMPYAPIVFISAKTGYGLEKLFDAIELVDHNYSQRIATAELNRLVREAMTRTPTPSDKGVRLKIFYTQQVASRPPRFIFHVNRADLFHFSYLRYMENTIRRNYDFTGVPMDMVVRERKGE